MTERRYVLLSAILIAVLGLAIYANSLDCKFVWDDKPVIRDNPRIRQWRNIPKIFTEPVMAGWGERGVHYRPLKMFMHMVNYKLWGLDVRGHHLTNVLLHILAALSLYWLVSILFGDRLLSLITGVIFLVHPVQVESVTYLSDISDMLSGLFIFSCLALYIKLSKLETMARHIAVMLCCILALLSKESGIVLPLLMIVYHYTFRVKLNIRAFLPVTGCVVIYLLLRSGAVLGGAPWISTVPMRIPGVFAAVAGYMRLILLPFGLHMDYGDRLFALNEPVVLSGIAITLSLFYAALKKRKTLPLLSFSILWFFAALLPVSGIYPNKFYMAEHFLYIPIAGFALVLAYAIKRLAVSGKLKVPAIMTAATFCVFFSVLTVKQNEYWKEPISFYERTLEFSPGDPDLCNNLGIEYLEKGRNDKAEACFRRAIKADPDHALAHYNLGCIYHAKGAREEAEDLYKRAIELKPGMHNPYNNLGAIYAETGKKAEAAGLFSAAISRDKLYTAAYTNLGKVLLELGRTDEALSLFREAADIDPALRSDPQLSGIMEHYGREW